MKNTILSFLLMLGYAWLHAQPCPNGATAAAILQYPDIMGWSGRVNPYFFEVNGFDLPETTNALAPFWDADGDIIYNPMKGDFPAVRRSKLLFGPQGRNAQNLYPCSISSSCCIHKLNKTGFYVF